jgi:hypothetical protein
MQTLFEYNFCTMQSLQQCHVAEILLKDAIKIYAMLWHHDLENVSYTQRERVRDLVALHGFS